MGALLAETERFPAGARRSVADIDVDRMRQERMRQGTFDDNRRALGDRVRRDGRGRGSGYARPGGQRGAALDGRVS